MPDPRRKARRLTPGSDKPMQIVFAFENGGNGYKEAFASGRLVKIDQCPVCELTGCLVGHGVYWRKPRDPRVQDGLLAREGQLHCLREVFP